MKGSIYHQFTLPNLTENAHLYSLQLNLNIKVDLALSPRFFVTVKCYQASSQPCGGAEEKDNNPILYIMIEGIQLENFTKKTNVRVLTNIVSRFYNPRLIISRALLCMKDSSVILMFKINVLYVGSTCLLSGMILNIFTYSPSPPLPKYV
jgi:hypothetical protein